MVRVIDQKRKEEAFLMRLDGKSFNQINRQLGVPKSTLSGWFRNDSNSTELKKILTIVAQKNATKQLRIMALANKKKWAKINEGYRNVAVEEFDHLKNNELFISGVVIYWGEGDKVLKNSKVRVSNVDFRMLKTFVFFLKECCHIPKRSIKAVLLLYPDLDDSRSKKYWSRSIGIPLSLFGKSQYIQGREKKKRLSYGVCTVSVCSRELKEKVIKWIVLLYNHQVDNAGIV